MPDDFRPPSSVDPRLRDRIHDVAGKAHWDRTWNGRSPERYPGPIFEFHDLYRAILPSSSTMTFLEVGAVPGNHLVYFAKEFGYRVAGIDYSSEFSLIEDTLALNDVEPLELFNEDVFSFQPPRLYDVVFSSGFVEHFDPPQAAVDVHANLVSPGGWLLLIVPNTRYVHAWLMTLNCPGLLAVHNRALMSRGALVNSVCRCGFGVQYCDYLRTFRSFYPLRPGFSLVCRAANKALRILHLDRIPNRMASPFLYLIARRPQGRQQ